MGFTDTEQEEYTKDNIWDCQGPGSENPPTAVATADKSITFSPPTSGEGTIVFGYRVTVEVRDSEDGTFKVHKDWSGKVFRTYTYTGTATDLTPDLVLSNSKYSIAVPFAAADMIARVSTLNMDGRESEPVSFPAA